MPEALVCDVAVVGGGPVGMLLGCLLAGHGLEVAVIERRTTRSEHSRAIGIHPPGFAALAAVGLGDAVDAAAAPIRSGVVTCRGRRLGGISFAGDPVRSLPQRETERLLAARLASLAPGALRLGHDVRLVRARDGGVSLAGSGGLVVRARYAAIADGVRSRLRGQLGIGWAQRPGFGHYVMADGPDVTGARAEAILAFEPDGVVESFPLPGSRRRWVVRLDAPWDAGGPGRLASLIAARTGIHSPPGLDKPSPFTARQHLAAVFARGRIALLGDAAHELSPIGGQGMNLGWLDTLRLADAVLDGLAAGSASPFDAYARSRRAAAARAIRQAAFNMSMGAAVHGPALAARNALVRTLAAPGLRSHFADTFAMRRL